MARFVYRMQSVLNIKQQTENQTKMEFAVAQNELNEQLDILDEYVSRKARYLEEAEELRNEDSLKLQDILDNQYATAQMDVMIKQQSMVVKQYEDRVEKIRVKLTKNVQERKMQETLKEKAFEQFIEEQKQEEAKENDQRSSFTYAEKQKED
ncbi:flagellar export protein FliJ [Butyrivibrio sp. CB08]|uniref:flagellar export protein FliJ n=1 Tax=Butyrivibrio sp. CB08 TaxID=2364879 RepID=UPI000EAA4E3A|nr:flagellar FliJ family protein [Butyrivibrio sp. CB08]RKM62422.1 flagellar export protein FliJ [Butyrivibrio sp. CB08]